MIKIPPPTWIKWNTQLNRFFETLIRMPVIVGAMKPIVLPGGTKRKSDKYDLRIKLATIPRALMAQYIKSKNLKQ